MPSRTAIPTHDAGGDQQEPRDTPPAWLWVLHIGDLERIVSGEPASGRGRWEERFRRYLRCLPYGQARPFEPQTLVFYTWREAYTYTRTYYRTRLSLSPAAALLQARSAAAPLRRPYAGLTDLAPPPAEAPSLFLSPLLSTPKDSPS